MVLAVIISSCFSSCFYYRMSHLSDSDLKWVKCYSRYPTATFVSNHGNTSKLQYENIFEYNSTNRFYFSEGSNGIYEANAGYWFEINQSGHILEGVFAVQRLIDSDSLHTFFQLGARSSGKSKYDDTVPLISSDFIIDSIEYKNCLIADSENSHILTSLHGNGDIQIERFVISQKYGLIYYKFENGEEFFRKFIKRL